MGKKNGRPSKFSESLAQRIFELAREGKTDLEIAEATGISLTTLKNWKGSLSGFSPALKRAKEMADELVVASLFQRAVGYSHPAIKFFFDKQSGAVVTQDYIEHYPPDTTACIFWLKNRQREQWRDVHRDDEGAPPPQKFVVIERLNESGEKIGETELSTEEK